MNDLSLKERADRLRELVWDLDDVTTLTSEALLLEIFALAEDLGAALLAAGSAEPDNHGPQDQYSYREKKWKKNLGLRVNFGSTPEAIAFAQDLITLRQDIERTLGSPDTDPAFLLTRIVNLYRGRKAALKSKYEHEVGNELDVMALRVAGITAREAVARERSQVRHHEPVPDEIAPIFTRQVISGGLPTLGRSRR